MMSQGTSLRASTICSILAGHTVANPALPAVLSKPSDAVGRQNLAKESDPGSDFPWARFLFASARAFPTPHGEEVMTDAAPDMSHPEAKGVALGSGE